MLAVAEREVEADRDAERLEVAFEHVFERAAPQPRLLLSPVLRFRKFAHDERPGLHGRCCGVLPA
jgi:hypothetical protein